MQSLEGQSFGDYEIQAKLGQGGMGAVYKAQQTVLKRAVALKVMAPQLAEDPAYAARFIREAAAAANLNHPNMVLVYTAGKIDGTHYIAMEFVDGESLRKRLDREGRLDAREAVAITVYITQALQYAWNKARLIHRDIKPDNIFLSSAGEVKVGDLGLAKSVGANTDLTASGMAMGSPHYISPEQARGLKDIDFRADIYSLGCTLYHMLTSRTPYDGDDAMSIMMKHVNDPAPAIFRVWPQCPMPLGMLVGRMLAKDRNARPRSYEDLLADLLAVHEKLKQTESPAPVAAAPAPAQTPTPAPVPRPETRGAKPVIRDSRLVIGGAVTVVVLLLASLFLWSPWRAGKEMEDQGSKMAEQPAVVEQKPAPPDASAWQTAINLLPLIDPQKDTLAGTWTVEGGALVSPAAGNKPLEIPYQPPEEYDFRVEFTLETAGGAVVQRLSKAERCFVWLMGGYGGRTFGFDAVDGQPANKNATRQEWDLQPGRRHMSVVSVRKGRVAAFLDDSMTASWETDYQNMAKPGWWKSRDPRLLGVGSYNSRVAFHRIEVREVTGKGTFMRAAPKEAGILAPAETRVSELTTNPKAAEVCTLDLGTGVTMDLMGIPPGEFMMGSTPEERAWAVANGNSEDRLKCEGDQPRKAAIKQGFWLGRTEVTVGQWKQFVAATGYVTDGEKKGESHGPVPGASSWRAVKDANWKDPKLSFKMQDNSAVRCISWDDAVAFCNWLNEREQKAGRLPQGFKVRLPVEPEWEYACRAGVQAKFWWGDSVEDGDKRLIWLAVKRGEVDSYGARGRNKFGLADMLGNVKEWCLDHFDPTGAHEELYIGDPSKRVVRGGSSYNSRTAGNIRCAGRGSAQAATSHCDYGFRICVGPDVLGSETTTAASVTPAVPQPPALDSRLSALDSFCREVAALPAEAQVQRVVAKLKELNPGFDPVGGVERSEIENGKVMGLWLTTGAIADLSPLRALTTLTSFSISTPRGSGTRWQQSRLSDLSPLRGMNLTKLWIDISQVSDLSPLAGQPLKTLFIISSPVTDLSPLRGMALEILRCEGSAVADLRPLAGMSSLRELNTHMTRVTDLSPLKGLQLRRFWCAKTKVRDLSVLRDMPLDKLWCDPDTAALSENVRFLKPIQTLKTINDLPAAEFWRRVEAGEVPQAK